ncbi:MAG TPA: O-antigen ligase family protein [Actinomycetota bacterium]
MRAKLLPDTARRRELSLTPLKALFLLFPVWYLAGIGSFVWALAGIAMLLILMTRTEVDTPWGSGVWFLFVAWMLLSALQIDTTTRVLVFAYRASIYGAATVLFLYVYNLPHDLTRRVAGIIGGFFAIVVGGGYLGLLVPGFSLVTLAERILPRSLTANSWVYSLVHVHFAQIQSLVVGEQAVARPDAPFPFTNEWGAVFALTAPFAVIAAFSAATRFRRNAMRFTLAVSPVPLVLSGNRGAWLVLGGALVYAAFRLARRGRVRLLLTLAVVAALGAFVLVSTSIGSTVATRSEHKQSNEGRLSIYTETIQGVEDSPLFGHGVPELQSSDPNLPAAGTHGQVWDTLYSQGIPGAVLYCGFLILMAWRTRRLRSRMGLCLHLTLLMAVAETLFYGQLPTVLQVIMVAAALGLMEVAEEESSSESAPPRRLVRLRAVA